MITAEKRSSRTTKKKKGYAHVIIPQELQYLDIAYQGSVGKAYGFIPPDLAAILVEKYHPKNFETAIQRPEDLSYARTLKRQIDEKDWIEDNPDNIAFSEAIEGRNTYIWNGLNRLIGTSISKKGQAFHFFFGVRVKSFHTKDTGKSLGAAAYLASLGVINANTVAAVARFVISYEGGRFSELGKTRGRSVNNTQIRNYYYKYGEPKKNNELEKHCAYYKGLYSQATRYIEETGYNNKKTKRKAKPFITPRIGGSISWIAIQQGWDEEILRKFFRMMYDPLALPEHGQRGIKSLIEKWKKQELALITEDDKIQIHQIIICLNNYLAGHPNRIPKFKRGDKFATVIQPEPQFSE